MKVTVGAAQWIGERERQEDSIAYGVDPNGRHLFVLADGMGGHAGGDIASRLASSIALEAMLSPYDTIPEVLQDAIKKANTSIADHIKDHSECDGMGTTLVCAIVENGKLWWSSVGDSHLYLFRGDDVKKLNADHSMMPVLQKMVLEGEITSEQAASDPKRNALRSAVMGDEIPMTDQPQRPFDLRNGDTIVLCTDGVDSIENLSDFGKTISSKNFADDKADVLLEAVKSVGRPRQDNTSIIVTQVDANDTKFLPEDKISKGPFSRGLIRGFVLPSITLILAVTTFFFAFSDRNTKLQIEILNEQMDFLRNERENAAARTEQGADELDKLKNDLKNKNEEFAEISKERDKLKELLKTVTSERDQFDRDAEKDKNSIVSFEATIKEMSAEISHLKSVIRQMIKR